MHVVALELDAARARNGAADGTHRRGLAGPVGAEDHDDLAFGDLQIEPVQHGDGAVTGGEATSAQERHVVVPRYASMTFSLFCTSEGVPSAILRPNSITTTRSLMLITIDMWCSTSSTVRLN